ncbi:DUF3843 family protein [Ornithobacterium rhinotracheale]|uniref:DUF3843 family protein n=1 Tax=Ornithobacterium rhinotracheale TaxID=28251 RepID=UPI00129C8B55|nr:DUF3843 family protein [Ornithobacterium rhinotracheale]MRI63783.1 DUF3843 family protein [Ornithobacterium rhinotracheale]
MSKIYIKDWMATKPYTKQTNTELFYLEAANEVLEKLKKSSDFIGHFLDKESFKDLAIFLTSYFEDVISNVGLFRAFIALHQEIYKKSLPFYVAKNYTEGDINIQDVQFLVWYFLNLQKQDVFVNPYSPELKELAQNVWQVFDQEYEYAPENTQIADFFKLENPENLDEVRYFIDKILTRSYLFTQDTGIELYMRTAALKTGNQQDFKLYKNHRDKFILNFPTKLLAKRGTEWAATLYGKKEEAQDIKNMGLNSHAALLYKGENGEDLEMEHLSSGKTILVSKDNFEDYKKMPENTILYAGISPWKGKYALTGIINAFNYDESLVENAKRDYVARQAIQDEKEKKEYLKNIKKQEKVFLEKTGGVPYKILSAEESINFINDFFDTLDEQKIEKYNEDIATLLNSIQSSTHIQNAVLFFNPNFGLEFYSNLATELEVDDNPFKEEVANPTLLMKLMMADTYSREFFDFYYQLMKEKKSAQIEFLKDFSEKDIDFMLRFYKPTRYGN